MEVEEVKVPIEEKGKGKPSQTDKDDGVFIGVEDVPGPHMCIIYGMQQAIMCIGSSLSIPFIVAKWICADGKDDVTAELLSLTMVMCGIATLLQTTFGVRLGIIQGGSHVFIAPIVAMMTLEKWKCPEIIESASSDNATSTDDAWKIRLREIQGNLILASLTQVILGCTGLMGIFLRFIGPLTIAPTISLIGLSLTSVSASFNEKHWGLAILTAGLIVIFSLFLGRLRIPLPAFSRQKKCYITRYPLFQLLPVILSVCISWLVAHILTVSGNLTSNSTLPAYNARTDARLSVVDDAPWFYFPIPYKFGVPTISAAGYVGMLAATLSSIIESIGDYYACASISKANPPPTHAVNRGIAIEGFSSIIAGLVGSGNATTSYSGNIGAIGITKVASRRVFQTAGIILIVCGIIGKFGAILTLIPEPIIGGTLTVVFGMVTAVGISTLRYIDMSSTRNLTILAISVIFGLMIPEWLNKHPTAINTGSEDFDQVLKVLLTTAMFVGGVLGFILDNLVPGTEQERGIKKWRQHTHIKVEGRDSKEVMYEYPYVTKYIRKLACCSYIPFSPTFDKELDCSCCKCCNKDDEGVSDNNSESFNEKRDIPNFVTPSNGYAIPEGNANLDESFDTKF